MDQNRTLRDEFAMSVIAAKISAGVHTESEIQLAVGQAYLYADEMLRVRQIPGDVIGDYVKALVTKMKDAGKVRTDPAREEKQAKLS